MRNHKFSLRAAAIVLAVPIALILTTAVALGHHATGIEGKINCEGWSVTVDYAQFGDGHTLVTAIQVDGGLPGLNIETPTGSGSFTYSGGPATTVNVVVSTPQDEQNANLTFSMTLREDCQTPSETPSPTETPSETPVATPLVTPSETPTATIPNTSLGSDGDGTGVVFTFIGLLVIGLSLMLIASAVFGKKKS